MLHRIENKIRSIEDTLTILQKLKPDCKRKFLEDMIYQGALLHYLYIVADRSIALAEMVLKYKNCQKSNSYYESIDMLGECGIIPAEFAYDFARIASFRNFLAHDYERIDYLEICEGVLAKIDDIKSYLTYVKEALEI